MCCLRELIRLLFDGLLFCLGWGGSIVGLLFLCYGVNRSLDKWGAKDSGSAGAVLFYVLLIVLICWKISV